MDENAGIQIMNRMTNGVILNLGHSTTSIKHVSLRLIERRSDDDDDDDDVGGCGCNTIQQTSFVNWPLVKCAAKMGTL